MMAAATSITSMMMAVVYDCRVNVKQLGEQEGDEAKSCAIQRNRTNLAIGEHTLPHHGKHGIDGGGEHQQAPRTVTDKSNNRICERSEPSRILIVNDSAHHSNAKPTTNVNATAMNTASIAHGINANDAFNNEKYSGEQASSPTAKTPATIIAWESISGISVSGCSITGLISFDVILFPFQSATWGYQCRQCNNGLFRTCYPAIFHNDLDH